MAEPVNHTLHVLREFREEFREFATKTDNRFDTLERKVDRNHEELKQRIENLRQAAFGESVLGRYAAAEVEVRLSAIESRLSALEQRRWLSPSRAHLSSTPH
jgi:hypothetical protein